MPPKKVVEATSVPGEEDTPGKESSRDLISIEDHSLPKSIVTRLAKGVLPANTQIQANATLAITKGATVFVNYLASHANEICQREGRKTLNPQDVLRALDELEFPDFKPRLEAELAKFNEIQAEKRSATRAKKTTTEKNTTSVNPTTGESEVQSLKPSAESATRNGEPAAKKARMDVDEVADADLELEDSNIPEEKQKAEEEDEEEADDDVEEDEGDTLEVDGDDPDEVHEAEEEEDEALDNGDDSD